MAAALDRRRRKTMFMRTARSASRGAMIWQRGAGRANPPLKSDVIRVNEIIE
jgi:hypothetical protein